jgi:hypothetical protein
MPNRRYQVSGIWGRVVRFQFNISAALVKPYVHVQQLLAGPSYAFFLGLDFLHIFSILAGI